MRDTRSITERDGAAERGRRRACDEEAALALPCAVSADPDLQQTDRQLIGAAVGIAAVALPTGLTDAPRRRPAREA